MSYGFSHDGQKFWCKWVDDEGPVSGEALEAPSCPQRLVVGPARRFEQQGAFASVEFQPLDEASAREGVFACRTPEARDVPKSATRGGIQTHLGMTQGVRPIEDDGLLGEPLHARLGANRDTLRLPRYVTATSVELGRTGRR